MVRMEHRRCGTEREEQETDSKSSHFGKSAAPPALVVRLGPTQPSSGLADVWHSGLRPLMSRNASASWLERKLEGLPAAIYGMKIPCWTRVIAGKPKATAGGAVALVGPGE